MIVAGLVAVVVAVVVFGVGLVVRGLVAPLRRTGARAGDAPAGDVAILLVARDRADRIGGAVASAAETGVPVFVVSDGSTDPTAERAFEHGAEVVETLRPLGPGGSVLAGVQSFRLAERYAFVLVLDVDVRLDPSYLTATLPLFGDAGVAAVEARVTGPGLLGRYLARTYALSRLGGRGRTVAPSSVTHAAPGVARLYRTEVLERLELDLPPPSVPNFDAMLQIYRDHLGRVVLSPGPPAVLLPPAPAGGRALSALARYREARRAMLVGADAAVRRRPPRWDRQGLGLRARLGERLGTALFVVAVLVAAVAGAGLAVAGRPVTVLDPRYLLGGFLVGDYLRTIAVTRRLPLAALAFPLLRVVDAVDVLRVTVRPRVLAWAAPVVVGVAVVVRVAVATATLPASAAERALADAGYRMVTGLAGTSLPAPLTVTKAHLNVYAVITDPFGRHLDVLTGARELSVLAAAVVVGGLIAICAALRVHPLLTAAVLVAFAAPGPVVAVFGAVGPGVVAAGWLAVALAVAVHVARERHEGWHPAFGVSGVFGLVALLVALATVPLLVAPLAVGVAVWLWFLDFERHDPHTTWRRPAIGVVVLGACVVGALWPTGLLLTPTGPVADHRTSLLVALTAVAVIGVAVPKTWPAVAATLTGLGLAIGFGPDADALLPATVVGAAITGVLVLDAVLAWRPSVATGLTTAVAAAAVAGLLVVPPVAPRPDHTALAAWVTRELDDGATITASNAVWADLHRDFVRLGRPNAVREGAGPLVVTTGRGRGFVLGRFGTLTLLAADIDRTYLDPTERATAGRQLATNIRLHASGPVRAALRAGHVDLRVMAVLAALCAEHEITLVTTENSPVERGNGLPERTVVVTAVDGRSVTDQRTAQPLLDWLRTQREPFAPADTRSTPRGLVLRWRLPDIFENTTR
ncbi:glycosyltransferase family 2 protein [Actinophytocola oryzae]|uniref:Cellulose synthase/poly-beta-1,6-N-acetylglucosamine synthase-like glycosyltransferase n=1 Tax=Actinophytocola oryzae TaxID=502181 RepID=A0A4V3FRN7_9PSEU|nr:glycosyltransferase [Actinophytocola oryzae]TDV44291.1 cellulose synthase/poly-beta-1,6-N-acetylglucosamine synthase-like glycosyltransferase [Actinophytocola oryzae]